MADISEININDIPYNIKDTQARNNIQSISSSLNNYLPLSGGTIEGGSIYNKGSAFVARSTIDPNNPPSENNNWSSGFYIQDKDGGNISYIRAFQSANTNQYNLRFALMKGNYSHTFDLKLADDGTKSVGLDKNAWLNALGASDGVWPISLGGTSATTITGGSGAVHNLFPNNLGTNIGFLTGMTLSYATVGYTKLPLSVELGGTGNTKGNAASATKLETARTIRTNLGTTSTASFNGTANVTPGVTGTLPIGNGGTGATSAVGAKNNLGFINGTVPDELVNNADTELAPFFKARVSGTYNTSLNTAISPSYNFAYIIQFYYSSDIGERTTSSTRMQIAIPVGTTDKKIAFRTYRSGWGAWHVITAS